MFHTEIKKNVGGLLGGRGAMGETPMRQDWDYIRRITSTLSFCKDAPRCRVCATMGYVPLNIDKRIETTVSFCLLVTYSQDLQSAKASHLLILTH